MIYHAIGQNILVEEAISEEEQIISTKEQYVVKGKVLSIGQDKITRLAYSEVSGGGMTPELYIDDIVWFNKRSANQMPFNEKLYIIEQADVLVVEKDEK